MGKNSDDVRSGGAGSRSGKPDRLVGWGDCCMLDFLVHVLLQQPARVQSAYTIFFGWIGDDHKCILSHGVRKEELRLFF